MVTYQQELEKTIFKKKQTKKKQITYQGNLKKQLK